MNAKFIAEDKGVSIECAERLSQFLRFSAKFEVVTNSLIWVKHEKARVYFELESQNRFYAVDNCQKTYYCAKENQLLFESYRYGQTTKYTPEKIIRFQPGMFSGAKIRDKVKEFCNGFIAEKANWH